MQHQLTDVVFWGKFDETTGASLPLAAHCIDVALVFRSLADIPGIRRSLEAAAGGSLEARQLDRLAVLAAYHDAGKANLGFQSRILPRPGRRAGHVREVLAFFRDGDLAERFASSVGYETIRTWADDETLEDFFLASWSHHGYPQRPDSLGGAESLRAKRWWFPRDGIDPFAGIREIGEWTRVVLAAAYEPGGAPLPETPRLQHRFAGLVMLADWIASDSRVFPIVDTDVEARFALDRDRIPRVLHQVGLAPQAYRTYARVTVPRSFEKRFGFAPRPLQEVLEQIDPTAPSAQLLVLEAETGSGKTEAAIHWFLSLFAGGQVDSLYFALPTRVAARELYGRVRGMISRMFPDLSSRPPVLLAVPGYSQIDGSKVSSILSAAADETPWAADGSEVADTILRAWAAERPKRFLASTIAVGTIDQAILSMVQSRHAHLRSVCLDRSLLVVDEVHASDRYTRRLLEDLLEHHLASGGSALLLSATLGAEARSSLVATSGMAQASPVAHEPAVRAPYPALTFADGETHSVLLSGRSRSVEIELVPAARDPARVLDRVCAALDTGARVLVVLNTVSRAISFFRSAEEAIPAELLFVVAGRPCPHHGRFSPSDRTLLDQQVTRLLGRDSPPGGRLIVGTQTLEQSLDIDADLLVTDLCPADVLLQRIGRLHRHVRSRPPDHAVPRCLVLVPDLPSLESVLADDGSVQRGWSALGYGSVYEDVRILELTRRYLESHGVLHLPEQNRDFVENVVHSSALDTLHGTRWARHASLAEGSGLAGNVAAATVSLKPLLARAFHEISFQDVGRSVTTRLGAPTWQLELPGTPPGPFDAAVRHLVFPSHLLSCPPESVSPVEPRHDGGFMLTVHLQDGSRASFQYTRYGLEPARSGDR